MKRFLYVLAVVGVAVARGQTTLLYDGYKASAFEMPFGDSANTVYVGAYAYVDSARNAIPEVHFKLSKKAGSISGKTFTARIWLMRGSSATATTIDTLFASSAGVAGNDSWSQTDVTFTFAAAFTEDIGTYYAVTCDAGQTFDASNYATAYFDTNSSIPSSRGYWRADLSEYVGQSTYNVQMQLYKANTPPTPPWTEHKGTISGQNYRILVPPSPNGRGILVVHSAGQNEYFAFWSSAYPTTQALLAAGYTLGESNAYSDNWGIQTAIDNYVAVVALLRSTYSVTDIGIWSTSMGGLCGQTLFKQGAVANIKCWFGVSAVCSLSNMYGGGSGTFASEINTAYNIPGGGTYSAQTAGYDPLTFSGSAFTGLKMRFYASAADTVVTKTANADAMNTLVTGFAAANSVVTVTGAHGDLANFNTSDILSFVNGAMLPQYGPAQSSFFFSKLFKSQLWIEPGQAYRITRKPQPVAGF